MMCVLSAGLLLQPSYVSAADTASPLKVGMVNFRIVLEKSKLGKQEYNSFEGMKMQMAAILEEKEKALIDLHSKVKDPDYLDGLSQEAEAELSRKFQMLQEELGQLRNQYMQTLNQANMRIMQKLTSKISEASQLVAKEKGLDVVFNEDGCFFCSEKLDISKDIVAKLDELFAKDDGTKNNPHEG